MNVYVIYRRKRLEKLECVKVDTPLNEYYTMIYFRENGYRVLEIIPEESIKFLQNNKIGKMKEDVWNKIKEININENYEIVKLENIKKNDRNNKNFREKYFNYFVENN